MSADEPVAADDRSRAAGNGGDLGDLLARAGAAPPVRIDPVRVRAAEARRRRRVIAAGASGVAVLAVAVFGLGRAALTSSTVIEEPAAPSLSAAPGWKAVTWNGLRWEVPDAWAVQTAEDAVANAAGPLFFTEGTAFGTVPMTAMCRPMANGGRTCSRANLISTWPTDGVVAWVAAASVGDATQPNAFGPTTTADPGPFLSGVDCTGHRGTPFHAYRLLSPGTAQARRVDVNGCVLGRDAAALTAQLERAVSTMDLLPTPPAPSLTYALNEGSWGDIRWRMPGNWSVMDRGGANHSYPAGAFVDGPHLGTVNTGDECRTTKTTSGTTVTECGRAIGIRTWPADGVLAWIDVAAAVLGPTDGDPGPNTAINCVAHSGKAFHGYRELPTPGKGVTRVRVDGCVFGPRSTTYAAQLRDLVDSVTLNPS